MKPLFLAIDQGGHATRSFVYDKEGTCLFQKKVRIETFQRKEGVDEYIEHDPHQLLTSVEESLPELKGLTAAGLVTQRSTFVCWDRKSGKPLSPAISWQDRRAAEALKSISSLQKEVYTRTGLYLSPHYGASKMRWCLENLPEAQKALTQKQLAIGPLSTFLTHKLCIEKPFLVDSANATRTLLWNRETKNWDEMLSDVFKVPSTLLPHCVPTRYFYGSLKGQIPLQVVTGDQSAMLFSDGEPSPQHYFINLGSGGFILRRIESYEKSPERLLAGPVYDDGERTIRVVEGTVNGVGNALRWFQDTYSCPHLEEQLTSWLEEESEGVLFLNGVAGVGSPFWYPAMPSRFVGEASSLAQRALALIESILFLLLENFSLMEKKLGAASLIRISGGLAQQDWICQKLSNLLALPVRRAQERETTARGLAYLVAGFPSVWQEQNGDFFYPQQDGGLVKRYHRWKRYMEDYE